METKAPIFVQLSERHASYRENSLQDRFFKHLQVEKLVQQWEDHPVVETWKAGDSYLGKGIYCLKTGTGPIKILLWSQMHGNEPTATMSLFDLLNFLTEPNGPFESIRHEIMENCTLFLLPMVNPDGAEVFSRRNHQQIDINRDFQAQQSPEARLLRSLRDALAPDFGFNLHDQSTSWSAGNSGNPATISLMAPVFDEQLSVNPGRENAMQVCSCIHAMLQQLLPGHIARFKEEFEPRSFGDNFQACGTRTILVEAGGLHNDPEKQVIRNLVFTSLVCGLYHIATGNYLNEPPENYFAIPSNAKKHFSLLLKNCRFNPADTPYCADLGLIAEPEFSESNHPFALSYRIEDLGDLSGFSGYETIDASACTFIPIKPPQPGELADFILQQGPETILSIENGRITVKTAKL